jgi:hypothetical protein
MVAMKLFWVALAFMLVMATMAKAWDLDQEDSDENSLELPELRSLDADDLSLEERKLHPYNTKNVFK